jgi:hypothetical protein
MNKPNNIQERIKLLMEYDTSKTYSENKELINEISIPPALQAWILKAIDSMLKILRVKKGPEALKQIKDKLVKPFKFKYQNPETLVNSLKGGDKIRYEGLLKEIKVLETKIAAQRTISKTSVSNVDIDSLLEYKKDLYIIFFEQMQKEFKKIKSIATRFNDNSLTIITNQIKSARDIKDLEMVFNSHKNGVISEYANIEPNLFFHYLFEITTGRITPASWGGILISYLITDRNLGVKPYTKERTIKTICGSYAEGCNVSNKYDKIIEVIAKTGNSKAKLFILSAIIYGLFKNKNKSELYRSINKCDFCKLAAKFPLETLELDSDENKYKYYIEAMLKYYKTQNKDAYDIIKYGFNYNKDGFTIDTKAFNQFKFNNNLNNVFKAYQTAESTVNNKKIIIENDNLLLNENYIKIAFNFLWKWFKLGINPVNYVVWVWKHKGILSLIGLIVKISIIDTNMARWLLRSLLRLPASQIELTIRIRSICETNLCLNNTPPKKEMVDFANLINNGGKFEQTVYGLVLADASKAESKYFTTSDICKLNKLTKNRFSTNFDIFVKQYGGRKAESLKSLFDYNLDILKTGVNVPNYPSSNNPLAYIGFAVKKILSIKDTASLMTKNFLGFTLIDEEDFIIKWQNNCLGLDNTPNTPNTNDINYINEPI